MAFSSCTTLHTTDRLAFQHFKYDHATLLHSGLPLQDDQSCNSGG